MVVWVNDLFGNSWYPAMWFNRLELWLICLWLWLPSLKFDIKDKKDRATLFVSAGVCSSFNSLKEQIRLTNPHWVTHSLPATNSCSKKRWSDAMPIYAPRIKKKTCFKDVQALSVVEPPRPQPNFKEDFFKKKKATKGQKTGHRRAPRASAWEVQGPMAWLAMPWQGCLDATGWILLWRILLKCCRPGYFRPRFYGEKQGKI